MVHPLIACELFTTKEHQAELGQLDIPSLSHFTIPWARGVQQGHAKTLKVPCELFQSYYYAYGVRSFG